MFKISFSELVELTKSSVIVALIFTIASVSGLEFNIELTAYVFGLCFFTASIGFILHEIAHKIAAQNYGYEAEYVGGKFPIYSLLIALYGLILLAPGAVHIKSMFGVKQSHSGIISLAGPLTNLWLAFGFKIFSFISPNALYPIFAFGFEINSWLALFNIIPWGNLDGAKVYKWNKPIFFTFTFIAGFTALFLNKFLSMYLL